MPAQIQDLPVALRALANHWAILARDYARDGKLAEAKDPQRAHYLRGIAEGYYKAATDLAALLKQSEARGTLGAAPDAKTAVAAGEYAHVPMTDVLRMFEDAGTAPRDIFPRDNGTYTAVFSKWEPLQPHERVGAMQRADARVVILGQGKTSDGGDPTVDFGYRK